LSRAVGIVWFIRTCLVVLSLSVGVLVFGPFSGAEANFGLTDKEAHALAFFALCACSMIALPRLRWTDIALTCLAAGALIEVIQPLLSRDGNVYDWLADAAGVGLCVVPIVFYKLRKRYQEESHATQTPQRRRGDRKRSRSRGSAARSSKPQTLPVSALSGIGAQLAHEHEADTPNSRSL
jgi:VanZ family protein